MNDDLIILASAYLDGDVTADERAQVESSPELLAEVDRLRTVRAVISHHIVGRGRTDLHARGHLAAALDAWDRLPDNERTGALATRTPTRCRRRGRSRCRGDVVPARDTAPKRRRTQSPRLARRGCSRAGRRPRRWSGAPQHSRATTTTTATPTRAVDRRVDARLGGRRRREHLRRRPMRPPTQRSSRTPRRRRRGRAPSPIDDGRDVDTDLDAAGAPVRRRRPRAADTRSKTWRSSPSDAIDAPSIRRHARRATVITDRARGLADERERRSRRSNSRCASGADVVVGPALYDDEPVVVGIDERRHVAVAYRRGRLSLVATRVVELSAAILRPMPGNPLTDPNWASDTTDPLVRLVARCASRPRPRPSSPLAALVFGIIAAFLGVFILIITSSA